MKYTIQGNEVFVGSELVASFKDGYEASYVAAVINQELGKYEQIVKNRNETIATQTAVIESQSERIKELERVLKQVDFICGNGTNTRIPKIERLIMELQLEESEDDNG